MANVEVKNAWLKLRVSIAQFFVTYYIWIVLATIVLIVGAGSYFVLLPKYRLYMLQKDSELTSLRTTLEQEKSRLEKLQNTQLQFEKFEQNENIQKLSKVLPTKREISDLFNQFEGITQQADFTLLNLSVSEDLSENSSNPSGELKSLRVQINVSGGGYNSMKGFLTLLEDNIRLFDINSLTFTPNIIGQTNYNLVITTYYID